MTWKQTYGGGRFDLLNPLPEDISLEDIAQSLANTCRFTGHCDHYSVAQHSVIVSKHVGIDNALAGLLHDAHEAYVGDMSSPMKSAVFAVSPTALEVLRQIEGGVISALSQRFGVDLSGHREIKAVDTMALVTEARDVMGGQAGGDWCVDAEPLPIRIIPWTAQAAKREFLRRFWELRGVA